MKLNHDGHDGKNGEPRLPKATWGTTVAKKLRNEGEITSAFGWRLFEVDLADLIPEGIVAISRWSSASENHRNTSEKIVDPEGIAARQGMIPSGSRWQ